MDFCLSASVSDFTDQQVSPHKNNVSTTISTKIATDQQGLCGDQQPLSSSCKSTTMAKRRNLHGAWSLEPHTCKGPQIHFTDTQNQQVIFKFNPKRGDLWKGVQYHSHTNNNKEDF